MHSRHFCGYHHSLGLFCIKQWVGILDPSSRVGMALFNCPTVASRSERVQCFMMIVSSAYWNAVRSGISFRSFAYKLNKVGSNIELCSIPNCTFVLNVNEDYFSAGFGKWPFRTSVFPYNLRGLTFNSRMPFLQRRPQKLAILRAVHAKFKQQNVA